MHTNEPRRLQAAIPLPASTTASAPNSRALVAKNWLIGKRVVIRTWPPR
jgi:hypothetical protein